MRRKPKAWNFILLVIIAGFLSGVVHLFLLRFETGDSYPAYSSVRADPLGSKVLYESLGSLEGMTVSRNYQPLSKLGQHSNATLFLFGMPSSSLNGMRKEEVRALESFVLGGGRLVFLLYPEKPKAVPLKPAQKSGTTEEDGGGERGQEKEADGNDPKKKQNDRYDADYIALTERWKIGMSREELPADADRYRPMVAVPIPKVQALKQPVSWHSSLWFEGLGPDWRTLYERDGKSVLIERAYGKGMVVLASDSYFVSNEAMLKERRPELLVWLAGPNSAVIFDETHFGIQESPGVVALGRKYRLHGLFSGLLLLSVLFIWKNSVGLVPPGEGRPERIIGARTGKDYLSGLTGLLRRTVPRNDIFAVCVEEWKKTNRKGPRDTTRDLALIESIVESETSRPVSERDPLGAYQSIHKLLSERKRTI